MSEAELAELQHMETDSHPPGSMERRRLLERELARYLRVLAEEGASERVIVFGSLATGKVQPWSDIDLVIVQKTSLPFLQRLRRVRRLLRPRVGTDILVYTPEEYEQLRRERPFFREEILGKGVVVYERSSVQADCGRSLGRCACPSGLRISPHGE